VVTGLLRTRAYRFLDMLLCSVYLPQREKYVAEVCIGMLDSYRVIRISEEYILVDFYLNPLLSD
jgi:hypothetical protein